MVLLGVLFLVDEWECVMVYLWFNLVEQLVFDDELFYQDIIIRWDNFVFQQFWKRYLEILQVVYCVVLYQIWEGFKESKCCIRWFRYSVIVFVSDSIYQNNFMLNYWLLM